MVLELWKEREIKTYKIWKLHLCMEIKIFLFIPKMQSISLRNLLLRMFVTKGSLDLHFSMEIRARSYSRKIQTDNEIYLGFLSRLN